MSYVSIVSSLLFVVFFAVGPGKSLLTSLWLRGAFYALPSNGFGWSFFLFLWRDFRPLRISSLSFFTCHLSISQLRILWLFHLLSLFRMDSSLISAWSLPSLRYFHFFSWYSSSSSTHVLSDALFLCFSSYFYSYTFMRVFLSSTFSNCESRQRERQKSVKRYIFFPHEWLSMFFIIVIERKKTRSHDIMSCLSCIISFVNAMFFSFCDVHHVSRMENPVGILISIIDDPSLFFFSSFLISMQSSLGNQIPSTSLDLLPNRVSSPFSRANVSVMTKMLGWRQHTLLMELFGLSASSYKFWSYIHFFGASASSHCHIL